MENFIPNTFLKTEIEKGDIISIRSAVIRYILDDRSDNSGEIQKAFEYTESACQKKGLKFWQIHDNIKFPIKQNDSEWDKNYYGLQLVYLDNNFSKERVKHIIELGKKLYSKQDTSVNNPLIRLNPSNSDIQKKTITVQKKAKKEEKDKNKKLFRIIIIAIIILIAVIVLSTINKKQELNLPVSLKDTVESTSSTVDEISNKSSEIENAVQKQNISVIPESTAISTSAANEITSEASLNNESSKQEF